jgi:GT2 family glycosyltransferase
MPSDASVAIVVPVHNALEHVQRCLASLVQTCSRSPLIVVDDCSDRETTDWLAQFLASQTAGGDGTPRQMLRNGRQQLFTRTVNRGIRWVDAMRRSRQPLAVEFVAVVNSDCVLHDNWLKALLLGMEEPRVGLVGYGDGVDGWEPALRESREPAYVAGHCMLLRMRMLEEIGVLCETDTSGVHNPDLAHLLGQAHYGSDRMLSWRANRAGWRTLDCHCRLCAHVGGASSSAAASWLTTFDLRPLWPPCDQLVHPTWKEPEGTFAGLGVCEGSMPVDRSAAPHR